jgi:glycosyltransferase involved in cell wall biosynthesis
MISKVGLLVEALDDIGGLAITARHHIDLVAPRFEIVPVCLRDSGDPLDKYGSVTARLGGFTVTSAVPTHYKHRDTMYQSWADTVASIVRTEGLEALHVYGAYSGLAEVGAYVAARCRIPLILSFRGSDIDVRLFRPETAIGVSTALAAAQHVTCVSQIVQETVLRLFRPTCPVSVVHNCIDEKYFDLGATWTPALPGPRIGTAGIFRHATGTEFLLGAFRKLASSRPCSLLMIGKFRPSDAASGQALVLDPALAGRIEMTGYVDHQRVLAYVEQCDVMVFPSVNDGSPSKVLEAMLMAKPIVATNIGGISEMVRDGMDGLLVPSRQADPLSDAIERLLDDSQLAKRLAKNAKDRAQTTFSADRARDLWLKIYTHALSQ